MTTEERFLTVGELLDRWKLDYKTLDKLMDAGRLGYVEFGPRTRRFPLSIVVTYEQTCLRITS